MNDRERASEYLLKIQDELDAMGRFPKSALPAAFTLTFGVLLLGVGLRGLWLGAGVDASPWILVGGVVTASGVTLALQARDWYRRHRSLERGIELFDKRRLEPPGEEP